VRPVINAVEERNLLLVPLHLHELPIHDKFSPEAFPVAVVPCDIVVVGESIEFFYDSGIRAIQALSDAFGKCADT